MFVLSLCCTIQFFKSNLLLLHDEDDDDDDDDDDYEDDDDKNDDNKIMMILVLTGRILMMALVFGIMANVDKGRSKWENNPQDDSDMRFKEDNMKSSRRGKPQVEIYRPGSGPLRKSGQGDEEGVSYDSARRSKSSIENSVSSSVSDEFKRGGKKPNHSLSQDHINRTSKRNSEMREPPDLKSSKELTDIEEKIKDVHISLPGPSSKDRRNSLGNVSSGGNSKSQMSDSKRKSRKPEQALYVPKPLAQAIAERDVLNKSPIDNVDSKISSNVNCYKEKISLKIDVDYASRLVPEECWDDDDDDVSQYPSSAKDTKKTENWDRNGPAVSRGESFRRGKYEGGRKSGRERDWSDRDGNGAPKQNSGGKSNENKSHSMRYSGNRRNCHQNESETKSQEVNHVGSWNSEPSNSPHVYQPRKNEFSREIRQASEPRALPPATLPLDTNRMRDTRSVEPAGRGWNSEKLQSKPPSGRRGSMKDGNMPQNIVKTAPKSHSSYDSLPPRLQKKYLENMGGNVRYIGTTSEDVWDGSTVTFQGSGGNFHQQNVSPIQHTLPQHSNILQQSMPEHWAHTLPTRARGRGRLRPEELEMERMVSAVARFSRSLTPDRLGTIPPSFSEVGPSNDFSRVPSHESMRGVGGNRIKSPPLLSSLPVTKGPVQEERRPLNKSSVPHPGRYRKRSDSNSMEPGEMHQQRKRNEKPQMKGNSPKTPEGAAGAAALPVSPPPPLLSLPTPSVATTTDILQNPPSPKILDWGEEVEQTERLEAEGILSDVMTRSSSLASLQEKSQTHPPRERRRRRRRSLSRERSVRCQSRDRTRGYSGERNNRGSSRERPYRGPRNRGGSKERNNQGYGRDGGNRGLSRERNPAFEDKEFDSRGHSREQSIRPQSKDRNTRDHSRERNYRGHSQDRNYRGQSRDRNLGGRVQNRDQNTGNRGQTRDQNTGNRGQSRERNNRGQSRERNNRAQSRERNNKGHNNLSNAHERSNRGSSRERGNRNAMLDQHFEKEKKEPVKKIENWREEQRQQQLRREGKDLESTQAKDLHKSTSGNPVAGILVIPSKSSEHNIQQNQMLNFVPSQDQLDYSGNYPAFRGCAIPGPNSFQQQPRQDGGDIAPGVPATGFVTNLPADFGYVQYPGITCQDQAAYITDQFGNTRPTWYDPYSNSFRSSRNPHLLLDIERADLELQWIINSDGILLNWSRVACLRQFFQQALHTLLVQDLKFCQTENVEQHFWKILFYNIIEVLRKGLSDDPDNKEQYKQTMLSLIEQVKNYFPPLLLFKQTYKFKLDTFLTPNNVPTKGLGYAGLALVSAQKIFIFLGDLARYKEQVNETSQFGKSRQCYIKAHQINPKNGRPYNQLAILALYARRKLDAVYYYMRSLMASNPFQSARESLLSLFDESRKKYEQTERKRREEREVKQRERMKEKEGAGKESGGNGLRREYWVHPEKGRPRLHITTSTVQEQRLVGLLVNKRFVTSYLHVHGKLFTKIGMETFQEAAVQMLREFRALLLHSPVPLNANRFLQLLALNMFAIENTQLKGKSMIWFYFYFLREKSVRLYFD
ncbi:hypothetical protein C0J52_21207 [Blattella germanica]|nr:hypothetical protein C0J52_21207 [Blattella germanica]